MENITKVQIQDYISFNEILITTSELVLFLIIYEFFLKYTNKKLVYETSKGEQKITHQQLVYETSKGEQKITQQLVEKHAVLIRKIEPEHKKSKSNKVLYIIKDNDTDVLEQIEVEEPVKSIFLANDGPVLFTSFNIEKIYHNEESKRIGKDKTLRPKTINEFLTDLEIKEFPDPNDEFEYNLRKLIKKDKDELDNILNEYKYYYNITEQDPEFDLLKPCQSTYTKLGNGSTNLSNVYRNKMHKIAEITKKLNEKIYGTYYYNTLKNRRLCDYAKGKVKGYENIKNEYKKALEEICLMLNLTPYPKPSGKITDKYRYYAPDIYQYNEKFVNNDYNFSLHINGVDDSIYRTSSCNYENGTVKEGKKFYEVYTR